MIILRHNVQDYDLNNHQHENMISYKGMKLQTIQLLNDWLHMLIQSNLVVLKNNLFW
jgi:hypothetical protein